LTCASNPPVPYLESPLVPHLDTRSCSLYVRWSALPNSITSASACFGAFLLAVRASEAGVGGTAAAKADLRAPDYIKRYS
jgi:hypothetical protein